MAKNKLEKTPQKAERAFSLTEILIVLLLFSAISPFLFMQIKNSYDAYIFYRDKRSAASKIAKVRAILDMPVFYCGFGMPLKEKEFKEAFASQTYAPFSWKGPLTEASRTDSTCGKSLRIVYAAPTDYITDGEYSVGKSSAAVRLTGAPKTSDFDIAAYNKKASIKNWLLIPHTCPMQVPLCAWGISGKNLSMLNYISDNVQIPQYARLFQLRAIECFAYNDIFYTKDFRISGEQPRVKGIIYFDFEIHTDKQMIIIYIAARGESSGDEERIINADAFPVEMRAKIDKGNRTILCEKFIMPMPNLIDSSD